MSATFPLLGGKLRLEDSPPRPPEDGLWLAASLTPPAGARVLDAMGGGGIVGLALLTRCPDIVVTGVEINPALAALASRNAALNGLSYRAINADLAAHTPAELYDMAFMNPPFHATRQGHHSVQHGAAKSLLPHALTHWLDALHRQTTPHATLALLLHSACREEVLAFATHNGYATTLLPLQTHAERPPKRLLAHLTRGGYAFTLTEKAPLGAYRPELRKAVLKDAAALALGN